MATINSLAESISELSHEKAFALIRKIRQSRLVMKVTKFTARIKKPKKIKKDPLKAVDKSELLKLLKESLR